jgi:2-polyprenyl-3-methyl-5-hydroxy-6-metoxy-1,4-benzoquinol methylase
MARETDPDALKKYARHVFDALGGAMTSIMIWLGDRLGLYRALADGEARTSAELATRTGLHERWIREWLAQQGAAGILDHRGGGHFALSAEGEAVLADEAAPTCGAGLFSLLPQLVGVLERLPEAFRTGIGLPYDAFGPDGAVGIERGFGPWFRALLVPLALPAIPGVVDRLANGMAAADIGCGAGVALLEMAKAFPRSDFHGWDISSHALARAEENRAAAGVTNVTFHDVRSDPLPQDGRFGFITTFDCLHDMTDPAGMIRRIRATIRPDGVWLIAEVKAQGSYEAEVAKNPMAPMMYGISVLACMSSALSESGGAGLGTLGMSEDVARRMTREAGFASFEALDLDNPINAFYVVRP